MIDEPVLETILIVEDEPVTFRAISSVLERNGFSVTGAETGEKSVEIINSGKEIDLVLMDVELMDGMNGLEAAEIIHRNHDIPVVFLSNHKDPDILQKVQKTASYGYVLKESGTALLLTAVKNSLRLHAAQKKLEENEACLASRLDELNSRVEKLIGLERMLAENEKNIATLTNNLPGMVYRCLNSPGYPMEFVSSGVHQLTGYHADDFTENRISFSDLVHPDDREGVWMGIQNAVAAGRDFNLVYRMKAKGNLIRWVMERGKGGYSPEGTLLYLEGFISDITDLKVIEERLRQSEATARALMNNPAVSTAMVKPDGVIIDANETAALKYNTTVNALKGVNIFDLYTDQIRLSRGLHVQKVVELKRAVRYTDMQSGKWWDNIIIPVFNNTGDVEKIIIWSYDVSELKMKEESLKLSEERFKVLFEKSPLGVIVADKDGKILNLNEELLNISGYNREEIKEKFISDFLYADADLSYKIPFELLFAEKIDYFRGEQRIIKNDGSILWVDLLIRIFTDPGNREQYAMVKVLDISGRKFMEKALKESEERGRRYLEESLIPIFISKNKKLTFVNNATAILFGYDGPGDITGRSFFEFIAPEERGKVTEINKNRKGSAVTFESWGIRSDGIRFPFLANLISFHQIDGISTLIFMQDISYKVEAEEKLKRANENLERRVAERTEEIRKLNLLVINSQEKERQRVAKDLHDGVGQTILAAKLALNSFMSTEPKDFSIIGRSINFIEMASQELREVYSGLYPSMLNELGLSSTIRWLIRNYLESAGISVDYTYNVKRVLSDNAKINIYRIIQEIFNNIVKYSGADLVTILFTEKDNLVLFTVEDNGRGFDVEMALSGATGAGLLNIRERVRNLGGTTNIKSVKGNTTITIELQCGVI